MSDSEQIIVRIHSPIGALAGLALAFLGGKRMEDAWEIRHALHWLGVVLDAEDPHA